MRTVSATEAKSKLSDLLSSTEYNQERIIIERSGRPPLSSLVWGTLRSLRRWRIALHPMKLKKRSRRPSAPAPLSR